MKTIIATILSTLILIVSSYASAQLDGSVMFRDQYGANVGSAYSSGGITYFRDQYGSSIGSASGF